MIELTRDGDVHRITMTSDPNLVHPDFVAAFHEALDEVEAACSGPGALILTGTGKSFNNGLDVPVVFSLEGDDAKRFSNKRFRLMHRLLVGPVASVAALNGHAFAAGAFLALACDFRVMRGDKGRFCISEVDAGVPIGTPMMTLLRTKLTPAVVSRAVLTGHRFTGADALEAGIVEAVVTEGELLAAAGKRAAMLAAKERGITRKLKRTLWEELARVFEPTD
jgi:enoyl-CoA hydratase/carnithine racemase